MNAPMKLRVGIRLLLLQARWDPALRQGAGFAFALEPWLAACWKSEPGQLAAARRRHREHFNTHPVAAWLIAGVVCRREAEAVAATGAEREAAIARINAIKSGCGASLAGAYDSFFWGALRPAAATAGVLVGMAARSPFWAAATALLIYNVPAAAARAWGISRGFEDGEAAFARLAAFDIQDRIMDLRRGTFALALGALGVGLAAISPGARAAAALTFAAGFVLSRRGVPPLSQVAYAGLGGMAASAAGFLK